MQVPVVLPSEGEWGGRQVRLRRKLVGGFGEKGKGWVGVRGGRQWGGVGR